MVSKILKLSVFLPQFFVLENINNNDYYILLVLYHIKTTIYNNISNKCLITIKKEILIRETFSFTARYKNSYVDLKICSLYNDLSRELRRPLTAERVTYGVSYLNRRSMQQSHRIAINYVALCPGRPGPSRPFKSRLRR